ncbi:MAG: ABC transporter ATP-binding protein [Bacteroidia bacterium]|nr:ABC transporter ATP-binding protein [Bacteroidia bacterium]
MANFAFEEEKLPSKFNLGVWKKMFRYTLRNWPLLIILALSMMITTFYDSSFTPLMNAAAIEAIPTIVATGNIMDMVINVKLIFGISFTTGFIGFAIIFAAGILIRSLSIFITFYVTNYFDMLINTSLRRDAFRRIQELSFSYFDRTPSGWLIARMQNDTASISDILSWGVIRIVWITFELLFTLVTMFSRDPLLSLIVLSTAPILIIITPLFQRVLLKAHRRARNAYSNFVRWLAECINGVKTIKTLNIEDKMYHEADEVTTDIFKKRRKAFKVHAFFMPTIMFISSLTTALVILFATSNLNLIDVSTVSGVATLVLFIGFVTQIYNPIQEFSEVSSEFIATQASVEKVLSLIETKLEIVDRPEVIAKYGTLFDNKKENFETLLGDIVFNHVSFSYVKGTEVIHDMNLHIAQGTSLAIVGETGSGKSTTANLLCRFYEPTFGQILIDDVDYKDRSVGWLRSNIGYVQQTPFIFRGTYFDNVRYGRTSASMDEVISACKIVGVHDFIASQKDGYLSELDDGGSQLSGGQKQLISFARALIRNPRLLILDEATSSIDTESEGVIQEAMHKILSGRTSIIIAHRLSTIVGCDRILVMSDGKIIEDGSHRELMNAKGHYYHLYMNQFRELNLESQISTYEQQIEKMDVKL